MELIIEIIMLIIGFVLLIKGADVFVDGASNVAYNYKIPTIIVGLTIVAFGTSAPEAAVSITASLKGSNAISLGNIVGSNIFNILGVLGISALIGNLKVDEVLEKRDFPIIIISSIILLLVAYFIGTINRIYVYILVRQAKNNVRSIKDETIIAKLSIPKSIIYIIIGLFGVIIGSNFVVNSASYIASLFGLSEALIGLTIVAIGTSLPELVSCLTLMRKQNFDAAFGDITGSNLFNFTILGIADLLSVHSSVYTNNSEVVLFLICTAISLINLFTIVLVKSKKGEMQSNKWAFLFIPLSIIIIASYVCSIAFNII